MAEEDRVPKPEAEEVTSAEHTRSGVCYRPNVDILEGTDELLVLADIPGARADSIDVDFEDGKLTIYAKVQPRREEDMDYLTREYGVGDFHRTFQVSEAIDTTKITAEYASGVLALHLPKAESAKPRKITVKAD
jgi:HSP20 family molecular chaperone IbpA